jgi:hypothetical protein
MRLPAWVLLLPWLAACSSEGTAAGTGGGGGGEPPAECEVGAAAIDPACALTCPAGEFADADGTCWPAGVPATLCAVGFAHDGDVTCEPTLPADACPSGTMAVPGDAQCREVAPCGDDTWGEIPIEANTVFVQAGAMGGDGSQGQPFGTIGQGVAAVPSGAIVAVAAGDYPEDVLISGKAVRIWGRCPSMVTIEGQGDIAAVFLREGSSGSEVHDLAIIGPEMGIIASGATGLRFSRLHVHDTAYRGIDIEDPLGPTEATLSDSLFENNTEVAWYVNGASLTVERSLARDVQFNQGVGRGANAQPSAGGTPSQLTIMGSVIERVPDNGVLVWGSAVIVDGTVIRDVAPNAEGNFGGGIDATTGQTNGELASLTVRSSLIERTHSVGIIARGVAVDVEGLTVRDVEPEQSTSFGGRGIELRNDTIYGAVGFGSIRWSLLERVVGGLQLGPGQWTVEGTRVRSTKSAGELGAGMIIQDDSAFVDVLPVASLRGSVVEDGTTVGVIGIGALLTVEGMRVSRVPDWGITIQSGVSRGAMTLSGSLVEDATRMGFNVLGADAVIEDSVVRGVVAEGIFGRGVNVQWSLISQQPGVATIRRILVEDVQETGIIVYGGDAFIEDTLVRNATPLPDGTMGDGVSAIGDLYPSSVALSRLRVQGNERAGVATFGASVAIADSTLTCNGFDLNLESGLISGKGTFDNVGGNVCGCDGDLGDCKVLSANLEPPALAEN